ncbi:helix-turn-helix transcriptional regulator [Tsukamurella tyrosinosolvens]|uniref:helix-turn-helix domain-containing protein n=1 Tax=Tsukamurella tyrosinosolvens TaxID=57704 RepID=UPI000797E16E|nr:helix-turn-helix transcriptional regulator [Tsukamurella tyrosinosolvens]KXP01798.1 hypothetical protein AXK59_22370 [Tsukamurella tyrosinosolvens]KZL94988.1 hypothetical protein AXX05_10210 [Tsukamurella tyrosinosolvens]MCA4997792.1 helix-turn-helix transcriptional regulator [Tsukamurella tyrosinosolvens]
MTGPGELNLAQALQRAFIEAGEPSISSVAAGSGVSRQRLSAWRSGRHVPSRFEDLEPVVAYLRLAGDSSSDDATDGSLGADRVTLWEAERWRQAWARSLTAEPDGDANEGDRGGEPPAPLAEDPPDVYDRKPIALAVVTLLVVLVAALAVGAFFLSKAYI